MRKKFKQTWQKPKTFMQTTTKSRVGFSKRQGGSQKLSRSGHIERREMSNAFMKARSASGSLTKSYKDSYGIIQLAERSHGRRRKPSTPREVRRNHSEFTGHGRRESLYTARSAEKKMKMCKPPPGEKPLHGAKRREKKTRSYRSREGARRLRRAKRGEKIQKETAGTGRRKTSTSCEAQRNSEPTSREGGKTLHRAKRGEKKSPALGPGRVRSLLTTYHLIVIN